MTVDQIIDEILRREGWPKYTNRASDRGGPTKGGITLATLRAWRAAQPYVSAADVEALTEAEVRTIYRHRYVIEPGYAAIADAALRGVVVDCAVLYGTDDAKKRKRTEDQALNCAGWSNRLAEFLEA
jgi:lysozyme family protein